MVHQNHLGIGLAGLANENTGCPIKCEFQINYKEVFSMSQMWHAPLDILNFIRQFNLGSL